MPHPLARTELADITANAAGANHGWTLVPRIGSEVAVQFIEGDIDRPVIVGGIHNGQDVEAGGSNPLTPTRIS